MDMELRHLRYFIVTAEELHFTRAAQRIGIAQPPLTFQIKALEQELGVKLFDRLPGHVTLTKPGEVLLEEARVIMDRVAKAALRCRMTAQGLVGSIGVGFTESASFTREVTWMLNRYRALYPHIELTLEEHKTAPLMQLLRQGRIDVAFVRLPIGRDDDVSFQLISTESMVVAVPKSHRFAERKSLRLADLAEELFVLYPRATRFGLSDQIVTACEAAGFSPRVVQNAPQLSSTINLVAGSLGISIVPACMKSSRADQVRYIPLRASELIASLGIAWRSEAVSPAVQNMLGLVSAAKNAT
jgi:DNA-binding transcriptional LysR family regulator